MKTPSPFMRQLGNALRVGSVSEPVASLAEAADRFCALRDAHEAATGETFALSGKVAFDGELYRISYNGRVWTIPEGVEVQIGERKTASQHDAEGWKDFRQ